VHSDEEVRVLSELKTSTLKELLKKVQKILVLRKDIFMARKLAHFLPFPLYYNFLLFYSFVLVTTVNL
jgi:hypothetical protein